MANVMTPYETHSAKTERKPIWFDRCFSGHKSLVNRLGSGLGSGNGETDRTRKAIDERVRATGAAGEVHWDHFPTLVRALAAPFSSGRCPVAA